MQFDAKDVEKLTHDLRTINDSWSNTVIHQIQPLSADRYSNIWSNIFIAVLEDAPVKSVLLKIALTPDERDRPNEKMRDEFHNMTQIYTQGFPLPQPYVLSRYRDRFCLIMEYIEGKSLTNALNSGLPIESVWEKYKDLMLKIRKLDGSNLSVGSLWDFLTGQENCDDPFTVTLEKRREFLASMNNTKFDEVMNWLELKVQEISVTEEVLTHGDFQFDNIMIRQRDQSLVLVDWDYLWLSLREYRFDIAWAYVLNRWQSDKVSADYVLSKVKEELYNGEIRDIDPFIVFFALFMYSNFEAMTLNFINSGRELTDRENRMIEDFKINLKPAMTEIIEEFTGLQIKD